MRLWKRELTVILGAGLLAALCAGTAFAAEERTKISSVSLTINSDIEAGDDSGSVDVTTTADNYEVTDVDIINDEGEWVSGDTPRVEITLSADDDYYFASMSKSKVSLKGDDATYVTSHREDSSSTLIITIKLDELEGSMEVEDINWEDDNSPIARWEESSGAKSYQVRLYRGSSSVGSAVSTTNTYYNFASSITREGEYYFKVRAVSSSNKKGDWFESDYIYVDEEMLDQIKSGHYSNVSNSGGSTSTSNSPSSSTSSGTWMKNSVGWWYQYSNGSYPYGGWTQINSTWYCFDNSGYMRTGWIVASDGKYYYCDPRSGSNEGAMLTNQRTPDGYWVDASGAWVPGQ